MSHSALTAGLRQLRHKLASQQLNEDSDESLLHAFAVRREDSAFAVLVRRHGPMVLHVCRRVLGHEQDAEDAFQATFLVLARSAASLRKKSSLASFLHGTAYRLALSAKRTAARRRKHENRVPSRAPVDPMEELSWREVRTFLDEEIARLPEKYQSVFVLCILENLSRAEAAQRLGLTERTVLCRLFKARKRLGQRLARRGVDLTAVLGALALATQPASALSPMLTAATIRAALATASGEGLAGMVSVSVVELAQGATRAVMMSKTKMATALLLIAALAAGAGAWTCRMTATPLSAESQEQPQVTARSAATPRQEQSKDVTVSGRVVDPDGKPVSGAKLLFLYHSIRISPKKVWATSTAEGRFAFMVPVKEVENNGYRTEKPWEDTHVLAAAEGYGFAVTRVGKPGATDLTLRLVKDDAPIRGRILDLQGKPVAGVQVRIHGSLYASEQGDLTAWLANLKDEKRDPNLVWYAHLTHLVSAAFDVFMPPATTAADGRFCIMGIGRERVAELHLQGPAIAHQTIHVMTRPSETIHVSKRTIGQASQRPRKETVAYFGSVFDLVAAPTRPIVGIVRDRDTGKPLSGVTIESVTIEDRFGLGSIRTSTDENGRYRLVGLPKSNGNEIAARTYETFSVRKSGVSNERPYICSVKRVGNPLGLEPVTVDFALKRGVWVKGRVTEEATGKPLFAARVEYFCFWENPNAREVEGLFYHNMSHTGEEDGSYRIPVLPGRGLITVRAKDNYIMAAGIEKIKGGRLRPGADFLNTSPHHLIPTNYHALVEISPKQGDESITCDVQLISGRSLKGKVLDPDGKPLTGVLRVAGLKDMGYWLNSSAEFTVESLQPNKERRLQFIHDGRKLSGFLILRGDEKDPISVRLQPWGTLTGRLITSQGEPLAGMNVNCGGLSTQTGKDGRFRIEGLAVGRKYGLSITKDAQVRDIVGGGPKDLTVKAGETKDLGELKVKPVE